MNQVNYINEAQKSTATFDNIDRIINATRIEEMQELKKLIKFIDHLIQSIIQQISNGLLSDKGAKIKILHCFSLIQHCQIGNHPTIKAQIDKLKRIYENTYKHHLDSELIQFKPKARVLSSADIHHYVESIKDSNSDPIYSEGPKSLMDVVNEPTVTTASEEPETKTKDASNKSIHSYFLSTLFFNSKNKEKIMALTKNKMELEKKAHRVNQFEELKRKASIGNIAATA